MSAIKPRIMPVDDVLTAIYRVDLPPNAWLRGVREIGMVDHVSSMAAVIDWHQGKGWQLSVADFSEGGASIAEGLLPQFSNPEAAATMPKATWCASHTELLRTYPLPDPWAGIYARGGASDAWGIFANDVDGRIVCASYLLRGRGRTPPAARRYWRRATAHLSAAARLRTALDAAPEAIFTPGGKLLHAEGIARDPEHREALRNAARAIDRARLKKAEPIAAIESWTAMVSGRWTLVDQFESDSKRFVVARVNEPKLEERASLSPRERHVAALVALGRSNKEIAYELGMSAPTVASHLHRICKKLGVTRAGLIGRDPRVRS